MGEAVAVGSFESLTMLHSSSEAGCVRGSKGRQIVGSIGVHTTFMVMASYGFIAAEDSKVGAGFSKLAVVVIATKFTS